MVITQELRITYSMSHSIYLMLHRAMTTLRFKHFVQTMLTP